MQKCAYLKYIKKVNSFMGYSEGSYKQVGGRAHLEKQMMSEKYRQAGIAFPSPLKQEYLLIVRLEIKVLDDLKTVKEGLSVLCTFLEHIDKGIIKLEEKTDKGESVWSPLSRFNFTGTIGFAKKFFKRINLLEKCPRYLYDMPDHNELGDNSQYVLQQTDLILQLASNNYSVNKMVLQNDWYLHYPEKNLSRYSGSLSDSKNRPLDISGAVKGWANISDIHAGFHRTDGRNLMGFHDGISNPDRLGNNTIWISGGKEEPEFVNGTYMVFQKIEHDLTEWHKLATEAQEKWVGRSKATGLLLGTLSVEDEARLVSDLHSSDPFKQRKAMSRLRLLINEQSDPRKKFYDPHDARYRKILKNCAISSHVRKANPRQKNGKGASFIFRRGYLYVQEEFTGYAKSGILFISFQNDLDIFGDMKKNMAQHIEQQAQ